MKKIIISFLILSALLIFSCSKKENTNNKLVIYTPASRTLLDPLIEDFKQKNPDIDNIEIIMAGSGELIKRIEAEKDNTLCDVLMTVNVDFMKENTNLFANYISTNEEYIHDDFKNIEGSITRFMLSPSVLIVNTNLIGNINIEGYTDLTNEQLKGKIAFNDASSSSSAFEHLVNMLYTMGEGNIENGWEYIEKLYSNLDNKILDSSSAVYKGVADGEYSVGLTYENAAADYVSSGAPVQIVYMKEGVIMKANGACIVKNAKNIENAKKFIDYITSFEAQKKMNDELNARAIRKDLPKSNILIDINEINAVTDSAELDKISKESSNNKEIWLEKLKDIIISKQ
ncbi:ABC transporter substrate-binding protein [Brachyspira intermedia]|uniref:ABC transporter substrate-binding protein n=1 Tax=Brachyspira intermedia TaxID=84377 RepID=UPI0030047659